MASPESQTAADIINAEKRGDTTKLQFEANSIHALADPKSIQKINQELRNQEQDDPSLPKMTVKDDGSIVVDGYLPGEAHGPSWTTGHHEFNAQEAKTGGPNNGKTTEIKQGDTTVVLNEKGEAVEYIGKDHQGKKSIIFLDKDGHWKQTDQSLDDGTHDKDLGTAAPRYDPNTGEVKRGDFCANDGSDVLITEQKEPSLALDVLAEYLKLTAEAAEAVE